MTLTEFILERIAEDEAEAHRRVQFGEGVVSSAPRVNPSPARVLAECEAKRRIVEVAMPNESDDTGERGRILRILATVYAEHPSFREEWRP